MRVGGVKYVSGLRIKVREVRVRVFWRTITHSGTQTAGGATETEYTDTLLSLFFVSLLCSLSLSLSHFSMVFISIKKQMFILPKQRWNYINSIYIIIMEVGILFMLLNNLISIKYGKFS